MKRNLVLMAAAAATLIGVSNVMAADLIIADPAPMGMGMVDVSGDWDGAYIGGFVGYGSGTATEDDFFSGDLYDYDLSGFLAGVALGANFTVTDGIVAGVVADVAWSGLSDDEYVDVLWTGSLRGRLGYDGGSFMPYLTAGLAVAGVDFDGDNGTHFGWTAGMGIEFAVADNMSVDLAYRYSDYGEQDYFDNGDTMDFYTHQVTVGLNWKF